jgi:hypothetical protein
MLQVIGRQRPELGGQGRAVQVRQLLGVQLDRQAMLAGGLEHPAGLGGEKPMPSQKASTASARPSAATAGIILADVVDVIVGAPAYSGGRAWAPRKVAVTDTWRASARARAARRLFSSSSSDRP